VALWNGRVYTRAFIYQASNSLKMMKMTNRKGFLAQQNTFLDTIATRFDGTRKY